MIANTAQEAASICVDYDLPYPPARVWRALTEPDLLAEWLMANDIRPLVGHHFTFKAPPMPGWDGTVLCEVLEVDAFRRIRYSWRGGPETMRLDTVVTWTLAPTEAGGTRLSLEHAGFLPANRFAFDALGRGWRGRGTERLIAALRKLD